MDNTFEEFKQQLSQIAAQAPEPAQETIELLVAALKTPDDVKKVEKLLQEISEESE